MVAIKTKYADPGNVLGARVILKCGNGDRRVYPWNYAMSTEGNHREAALKYVNEKRWTGSEYGTLASGFLDDGYVHVLTGF